MEFYLMWRQIQTLNIFVNCEMPCVYVVRFACDTLACTTHMLDLSKLLKLHLNYYQFSLIFLHAIYSSNIYVLRTVVVLKFAIAFIYGI